MYNLVFGQNPLADIILGTLGFTREDIGRFRDAYVCNGKIAIYTRLGGNNRLCFCEPNEEHYCYIENIRKMESHPNFLYYEDDEFDNTYATYYFSFPEKFKELLQAFDTGEEWKPDERWLRALDAMKKMSLEELQAKYPQLCQVVTKILESVKGG
jgi:hypothetical protein